MATKNSAGEKSHNCKICVVVLQRQVEHSLILLKESHIKTILIQN